VVLAAMPGIAYTAFQAWPILAFAAVPSLAQAQPTAQVAPPRLVHVQALTPTAHLGLVPPALSVPDAGVVAAHSQFDQIKARLAALRSGSGRNNAGVASTGGKTRSGTGLAMAATEDAAQDNGSASGNSRVGFFASGTYSRGDRDQGTTSPGADYRAHGFIAGIDYRATDRWIFGGTLAMNREDIDLDSGQGRVDADSWSVGGYTTFYSENSWYSDAMMSFGHNQYDLRRTSGGQTFRGDMDGDNFNVAATLGRDFNNGPWNFAPYGRLLYTKLSFDDFTETVSGVGPSTPQTVSTHDFRSFSSVLGGKLSYTNSTDWGVVVPVVQAEWQHEFDDDPALVTVTAQGFPGAPIEFRGDPTDTDYFRLGVGASFVFRNGKSGFIYYEHLLGREDYSQGSLAVGLRIEF
jgi:outer membrane autotransporter protein